MRAFAQSDRFLAEVESRKLRPAYVFVGDEAFFRRRCRDAILKHLVPEELRDFSLFEFDLSETDLAEVLDRARTPSLMAPFQIFFVKGVKTLFGRGSNEEKLATIESYCKNPNPDAVVIFVADARQRTLSAHPRGHGAILQHHRAGACGRRGGGALDHRLLRYPVGED